MIDREKAEDIREQLTSYLRSLAPHVAKRQGGTLLLRCLTWFDDYLSERKEHDNQ